MIDHHPKNVDTDHGDEKSHHEFTNHSLPTANLSILPETEVYVCLQGSG